MNEVQSELLTNRICEKLDGLVGRFDYEGEYSVRRYGESDTRSMPQYIWRPSDVIISKDITEVEDVFTEVENIGEWFPFSVTSVPIVQIYIIDTSDSDELTTHMVEESLTQDPPVGLLPCFVLVDKETKFWSKEMDYINGNIIVQETYDAIEILELLLPQIDTHLRGHNIPVPEENELLHDVANFLGNEIFHFEEVYSAYRNNRFGVLVVLLSVYFESYLRDIVTREYPDTPIAQKSQAGDNINFGNMTGFCRNRGEITEKEETVIESIREERNSYAHELTSYHLQKYSETKREGILQSAIKIYEDWMELEKSML